MRAHPATQPAKPVRKGSLESLSGKAVSKAIQLSLPAEPFIRPKPPKPSRSPKLARTRRRTTRTMAMHRQTLGTIPMLISARSSANGDR